LQHVERVSHQGSQRAFKREAQSPPTPSAAVEEITLRKNRSAEAEKKRTIRSILEMRMRETRGSRVCGGGIAVVEIRRSKTKKTGPLMVTKKRGIESAAGGRAGKKGIISLGGERAGWGEDEKG